MKIIVSLAANQHIRMISEGSCDIENWRNDAESSALHWNKLHVKNINIQNSCFKQFLLYLTIFTNIFNQINAAIVIRRQCIKTIYF